MTRFALAGLCCLTVVAPLAAQTHPLEGRWSITYAAGARMGPDGAEVITGNAALVFEAKGDSLIGTLTPEPVGDMPARPPARMAAARTDGKVTFIVKSTAQLHLNGEEREATSISTWVLGAEGDTLTGTVARRLEGVDDLGIPPMEPAPVNGTRTPA